MMRRTVIFGCAVVFLASLTVPGTGDAAEEKTVKIGRLELPADSPLARNEHPRLFFTRKDLPLLKERCQGIFAKDYAEMKAWVDREIARGRGSGSDFCVSLGLLYQLTGEEKYLEAGRKILRASRGGGTGAGSWGQAVLFDCLYDRLTKDEIRTCVQNYLDQMKGGPVLISFVHGYNHLLSVNVPKVLVSIGSGVQEDLLQRYLREIEFFLKDRNIPRHNMQSEHSGGWSGGYGYGGGGRDLQYTVCIPLETWSQATGEDLWEPMVYAKYMAQWYMYGKLPHRRGNVRVESNSYQPASPGPGYTALLASRCRDPYAQWFAKDDTKGWQKLLWYDPTLKPKSPDTLPPSRLFKGIGWVIMREGWGPDDTFAVFKSGPLYRYFWTRRDNNSFVIHRRGNLAIDSGTRCGKSNPGSKVMDYYCSTIAHNTVLLGGDGESQDKRMHVGEWVKDVFGRTPFGRITAYETNPLYDYACGDAAKSYRPEKVTHFTRQFVYLRPSCFVVFDRVGTVKKDFRKRWLLHSEAKPRIDGNTLTIDAVDLRLPGASGWKRIAGRDGKYESGLLLRPEKPGQQLELKFKGVGVEIVYTVGPEYGLVEWTIDGGKMKGKFDQHADAERNQQVKILAAGLEMGEHTLRLVCPKKVMNIELVRIHQRGRLFSRALLPKRASITLVGGPGKEWWIDGQNRSPLPSDRYAGWWYSQDPGVWRVEVEPKTAARDALFLHVLQATERTNPRMVKTQYVEGTALELFGEECWRGGDHVGTKMEKRTPMVGVKITFAGKVYTVCFWKEGPTAGRVRVEDAGTGERLWDSDLVDFNKESYAWWAGKRR